MHLRLVSARLITLLRILRESAALQYGRVIDLNDLNRQLISMIGGHGGLSSNELVVLTGHEKAQISRAVKLLESQGLIERASLRSKLMLRESGHRLFETILEISRERDAALSIGMTADMRTSFWEMAQDLTVRAAQIYAEERQLTAEAAGDARAVPPALTVIGFGEDKPGISRLLGAQLAALASYLRRSAMLAYQREQGLSNFQWMILSQIGEYEPLPLARLIEIMGRDKSQVGRTVAFFEECGLIERKRVQRKRDIMVTTTAKGAEVYKHMCAIAIRRDEKLTEGYSAEQRAVFIGMLERLEANARAMAQTQREATGA